MKSATRLAEISCSTGGRPRVCLPVVFLGAALGWVGSAELLADGGSAVVYDNTATYTGLHNTLLPAGAVFSTEHGNEVTLDSMTNRKVFALEIRLGIFCCGPAQFDIGVRFYANDGPAGRPGTVLWAGDPVPAIIDSGNPDAIPLAYFIDVPDVIVPQTFTWTVQLSNRQGNPAPMGPSEFDPPASGLAPYGFWERTGPGTDDWSYTGRLEPPFGAKISAGCVGDLNGCGSVDAADLAVLLGAWGSNPGHVADINSDGIINAADLALLLGSWGPCI